jgi:hypothetical protein
VRLDGVDEHEVAEEAPVEQRRSRTVPGGAATIVLTSIVMLPFVVAVVRAIRNRFFPIGDNGLLEIRSHDVLTRHHPLLGTWSSASVASGGDMNHPGPLLFDAVALPVKLLGGGPGMAIGVALVNLAAVGLAAFAGHRLGGRLGALAALAGATGLAWTLGSELLIDVWQPHVLVLPCFAFLVLLAAVTGGRFALLPAAVGVGSLLVQTHLSYAVLVPPMVLVALGVVLVRARAERSVDGTPWPWRTGDGRRTLMLTVAVAVVAWAQPLIEQLANGSEGNLARLARSSGSDAVAVGPRLGLRLIGAIVALPPWWTRSSFESAVPRSTVLPDGTVDVGDQLPSGVVSLLAVVVVVTLLALAVWRAIRTDDRLVQGLGLTALAGLAAGWATMLVMPIGAIELSAHQMRWLWPISALVMITLVVAAVRELGTAAEPAAALGFAVVIALVSVLNVPYTAHDIGPTADRAAREPIRQLNEQLDVLSADEIYLFDVTTLRYSEPFSGPFLAELRRRGLDFVVDDSGMVRQLGSSRRHRGDATVRIQLHETGVGRELPADGTVVASVSGLEPPEVAELEALREQVAAAPGIDVELARSGLLAAFIELGTFEPPALPDPVVDRYLDLERRLRIYSVAVVSFPMSEDRPD